MRSVLGFERVGRCRNTLPPAPLFGTCGHCGVSMLGNSEGPRQGWCLGAQNTLGRLCDHRWRRWVLLRTLRNPQAPASPRTNLSVFSIPVAFLSPENWQSAYASLYSSPDWCLAETLGDPPSPAASRSEIWRDFKQMWFRLLLSASTCLAEMSGLGQLGPSTSMLCVEFARVFIIF